MIERIKARMRHDEGCVVGTPSFDNGVLATRDIRPCNCSRREEVAWLEAMHDLMVHALIHSAYPDMGRSEMTTEQREFYDEWQASIDWEAAEEDACQR